MKAFTMLPKLFVLTIAAVGFLTIGPSAVQADEVFIAGSTLGCFGAGCTPGNSATIPGLTYAGSTFAGTTANGFRGLGSAPNPGSDFNNLGSFILSSAPNSFDLTQFTLRVTFTSPQDIAGGNQANYSAVLFGTVRANDQGGVSVLFNGPPQVFTFNDTNCEADPTGGVPGQMTTCGVGTFSFSVNTVAIDPGSIVALTGQVFNAQQQQQTEVPEPASMLLLGTGLTGIAGAVRQRRKNRAKE